jgi:hypothetical protein
MVKKRRAIRQSAQFVLVVRTILPAGISEDMAGARGIEPRSKVLETFILAVVLCPFAS